VKNLLHRRSRELPQGGGGLPARQAEEQRPAAGSRIAMPRTDLAIVDP
jgi:hypothetical protein